MALLAVVCVGGGALEVLVLPPPPPLTVVVYSVGTGPLGTQSSDICTMYLGHWKIHVF